MTEPVQDAAGNGADALLAAACFALDPAGLGGVALRTDRGEACELWLALLRELLGPGTGWRTLPVHIDEERLLGGLDLGATLGAGRAVYMQGLLAESRRGVVLIGTAERLPLRLASLIAHAQEQSGTLGFGLIALDGSRVETDQLPPVLLERLALCVEMRDVRPEQLTASAFDAVAIALARGRLAQVTVSESSVQALCISAAACGIDSMRVPLLALRVARACAALAGRQDVGESDLRAAARLVIGPRARIDPRAPAEPDTAPPDTTAETPPPENAGEPEAPSDGEPIADQVLAAARAAIPAQLLASLSGPEAALRRSQSAGRSGATVLHGRRGRPAGVRAGKPRGAARLNVVATLRTAAPWQRLRRLRPGASGTRVLVHTDDFRVTHFRQRSETATIFVLDASGSSALHRLAETKGAVELLLAECYVRRDQVAVVAFRGKGAEVLLPPTRSLIRAKRSLAGLPGGGTTPLASGIDAGRELAEQLQRRGITPSLVLLTDGQANVARDGLGGRERAQQDAQQAAKLLGAAQFRTLLIDTSPRPQPTARRLAETMCCRYLPLPYADARTLAGAVQAAQ